LFDIASPNVPVQLVHIVTKQLFFFAAIAILGRYLSNAAGAKTNKEKSLKRLDETAMGI